MTYPCSITEQAELPYLAVRTSVPVAELPAKLKEERPYVIRD